MYFYRRDGGFSMLKVEHHGDGSEEKGKNGEPQGGAAAEEVLSSTSSIGQSSLSATSTSTSLHSSFSGSSSESATLTAIPQGSPTSTPGSVLTLNISDGEVAACSSLTITWDYAGKDLPLTLFVVNGAQYEGGVASSVLPFSPPATSFTSMRVFATGLPSAIGSYIWKQLLSGLRYSM